MLCSLIGTESWPSYCHKPHLHAVEYGLCPSPVSHGLSVIVDSCRSRKEIFSGPDTIYGYQARFVKYCRRCYGQCFDCGRHFLDDMRLPSISALA